MPRFEDQALCLRLIDWSETSQIVALLTREHGKLRGVAKGARRMSPGSIARFSGGLEIMTRGGVVALVKPSSDLANLTEWDLRDAYPHLRTDLASHRLGLYGADLANAILADHDPHPAAFDALANYWQALREPSEHARGLLGFQWGLLDACGYRPAVGHDARTGATMPAHPPGPVWFDPRAGGFTESSGGAFSEGAAQGPWRVRVETLACLRDLDQGTTPEAADSVTLTRANRLLCAYVRVVLDRELPTMRFVLEDDAARA